ncbi:cysteine-rich motor neuron 1 protein [Amia ocellicauda]|uniref:cysteine-rich motor neuron 1 protein n=1 Tax=Amia ocellicauda TaxID=2972642 RepID=UPI003463BFEC|nr:CRIM1 protein [Amia calva]
MAGDRSLLLPCLLYLSLTAAPPDAQAVPTGGLVGEGSSCGGVLGSTGRGARCEPHLACLSAIHSTPVEPPLTGMCLPPPPRQDCASSCPHCPKMRTPCPGRYAVDPCGCCRHCARQRAEVCGGPSWQYGYCDTYLTCASINDTTPIKIPNTGVCKELPGVKRDPWEDDLCPWVWGCGVRVGNCDCYSEQTCFGSFTYSSYEKCWEVLKEFMDYDPTLQQSETESKPVPCTHQRCELTEGRCVCQERSCFAQPRLLTVDECEDQLLLEQCRNISCPTKTVPSCPLDSFLTKAYTPVGDCCPLVPSFCTCDFKRCASPSCPPGWHSQLISKGTGVPGNCCPLYQCTEGEVTEGGGRGGGRGRGQ